MSKQYRTSKELMNRVKPILSSQPIQNMDMDFTLGEAVALNVRFLVTQELLEILAVDTELVENQ